MFSKGFVSSCVLKEKSNNIKMVSIEIVLSEKDTDFTTIFNPPIRLHGKKCEIALASLETFYTFPNITEENNTLRYSRDNGNNWEKIVIPTGSYGMGGIQNELKRVLKENNDYDEVNETYPFNLLINKNTIQIVM